MGYSTEYQGVLKFGKELTASQLGILNEILDTDFRDLGEDVRDSLIQGKTYLTYINLILTDDFSGITWNGAEKSHSMIEAVYAVTRWMQLQAPNCKDFTLIGTIHCQGEDMDDRWDLVMVDGMAKKVMTPQSGTKIQCPHCEESFYYDYEATETANLGSEERLVFCITGKLSKPRKEITKTLEQDGYKVVDAISSNVDYLLCGEKSGSKVNQALRAGVKVISEDDLVEVLIKGIR
jgi:NAD-dependent DNA ligase